MKIAKIVAKGSFGLQRNNFLIGDQAKIKKVIETERESIRMIA